MSDTPAGQAVQPDDYAKYGIHGECVAEFDRLRDHLEQQFPPCPECGCRTSDDADIRDCGCDAGCNDGPEPPGVNVLVLRAEAAGRAAQMADAIRLLDDAGATYTCYGHVGEDSNGNVRFGKPHPAADLLRQAPAAPGGART